VSDDDKPAETRIGTVTLDHETRHDVNPDPITSAPGSHPVGAVTGAAIGGAVGGLVGAVIGVAVGGVAGGLAGRGVAEGVNPTEEDAYWRDNYRNRPYVSADRTYDDYQPAYKYGWESRAQAGNKTWEAAEPELGRNWNDYNKGAARQTWDEAKHATKDAWNRITDRTENDRYWRDTHTFQSYYKSGHTYDDYAPAYRYGYDLASIHAGRKFDEVENDLQYGWEQTKGKSKLAWSDARHAVKDSWHRVERALPGDSISGYSAPVDPTVSKSSLEVRLPELHDRETGRLDAANVANYLRIPLKQLSESLGRNYSTVHKTPSASAIQEPLRSIKRTLEVLEQVFVNRSAVLAWLNSPHPDLGRRTPLQVILEGYPDAVEDMLEGALTGTSS
jgi:hypothetical protein